MTKIRILTVEDEPDVLELLSYNLEQADYEVIPAVNGLEAIEKAVSELPDLILLDLMLPVLDGFEVCKVVRARPETKDTRIIMLTARSQEEDIVKGLELGADDYITKPFSPKVLLARISSVLRRSSRDKPQVQTQNENLLTSGRIAIDTLRHKVTSCGETVELTSSEFKLLKFLMTHPGWVFTRYQIVDAVHGEDYPVTDRSVDVMIVGLRKKLGDEGEAIETVRGVGYRFRESLS
ncbi:Phosphate regulon transcriptional regulatory protein PhoB [Limihaloglobus sulfuriphilus]|uniref:Phosphate regulon transcriptional regulatory protein PhoB n=1 Tax=Limihaloglobus sulfuriphilus TaxID=1851148 RepID=A0A1Q2MD31_9BACT|nr:response regulator [Limihaloglobus sulfuriphilus]AQQ70162.1 Phosphate regulon transcriptional regulatory protein PhoB [Limihaloglobus sulfuriphilus]